ncbi:hypothetical protein H4582DRAFT_1952625 [Lactarius indigo]|nr:hypothetical protein H4582DRAFT_2017752 [Lactarius indigo]KAI9438085.1 hypothetical protein H4582DRAFT_1952625 [Lactarius indigo]
MDLERDIADFPGTEASILYSQRFSTILYVISAFEKRGDIILADRGINFGIQKGPQIWRCTVRWFGHNDLKSVERMLEASRTSCKAIHCHRGYLREGWHHG